MALDPMYIVAINLQEYLVNKDTGLPLANGYVQFWEDDSRTTPKTVYELTGAPPNYTYTALPNPVRLSAVGVPVDANGNQTHIYYYPYDSEGNIQLYYISVYSANDDSSIGVLQYTLQAWPNITASDTPSGSGGSTENQISNSQFSQVLFVPNQGLNISFTTALADAVYSIAQGWDLIVSSNGAGAITIQQESFEGALNIPTNPPCALIFQPTGSMITKMVLRQTMNNNPDIWSTTTDGAGYISGIMLISSLDAQPHTLTMQYEQSSGSLTPQIIVTGSTLTTGYQLLNNTILLTPGTNTDNSNVGSIYIDIVLPTIGYYSLTSVQIAGTNNNDALLEYQQETVSRQIDHLYHYYQPEIFFKPIKSYLCGWDFPLNPAQFNGSTVATSTNSSFYLWDQTIGWQSIASSLTASRATTSRTNGCLKLNVSNNCQIAIIQYLTLPEIIELLTNRLSSNIILSSNQASLVGTISLWTTNSSNVPNLNTDGKSLISTIDSNGKPNSFNDSWSEINRSNYGDAIFTLSTSTSLDNLQNFGFNGWDTDGLDVSTVNYFAIVIGFSTLNAGNSIVIQSCSLVPGDIATIPAPQTYNEVLSDCQYYYEKSYDPGTIPGTATYVGSLLVPCACFYDGTNTDTPITYFEIKFMQPKVRVPVYSTTSNNFVTFYSAINANTTNTFVMTSNLGPGTFQYSFNSNYLLRNSGLNCIQFNPNGAPYPQRGGAYSATAAQIFHYTIDTRLGVY